MKTHKYITLIYIIYFLSPNLLFGAKLQIGSNISIRSFTDSKIRPGFTLGYEGETSKQNILQFRSGIYFTIKAGKLTHKRVWAYPGVLSLYDIKYSIAYLQIPFLFKYSCLWKKKHKLHFKTGPSLAISIKDFSKREYIKKLDDAYMEGETDRVPSHDYVREEDPPPEHIQRFTNSNFFFNFAVSLQKGPVHYEFLYNICPINNADYVRMNEIVHSVSIIIGYSLNFRKNHNYD